MPVTYKRIATLSVTTATQANLEFTNIPGTYTDLVVLYSARSNRNDGQDVVDVEFNGSGGTAYSSRFLYGSGSAAGSESTASKAKVEYSGYIPAASATASTFGNGFLYIPNYTSSNNKSVSADGVAENNATAAYMNLTAGLWSNTSVITSIKLLSNTGSSFVQHSTAVLYGILKA